MINKIIYLTGAPAAGKSTLASTLALNHADVEVFEYGARMSDWLSRSASVRGPVDQEELRGGTSPYVRLEDIRGVNALMRAWIDERSQHAHLLIDSHQVTFEEFGLFYVPFQDDELWSLPIDEVWVMDVEPHLAIERIERNPKGRPLPSEHLARLHSSSQLAVATAYGAMKGVPVVMFDGSRDEDWIADIAAKRLGLP